jgi:hypothetical protein
MVENLCGYVQTDLLVGAAEPEWPTLEDGNAAARGGVEVNAELHSEGGAGERLVSEREVLRPLPSGRPPLRAAATRTVDKRGSVRFGSGSTCAEVVGRRVRRSTCPRR